MTTRPVPVVACIDLHGGPFDGAHRHHLQLVHGVPQWIYALTATEWYRRPRLGAEVYVLDPSTVAGDWPLRYLHSSLADRGGQHNFTEQRDGEPVAA